MTKDDVYLLNTHQLLDWMRNPVDKFAAKNFAPWKIQCDPHPQNCIIGDSPCELWHQGEYGPPELMYVQVCGDCPNSYPWIFNPLGDKNETQFINIKE